MKSLETLLLSADYSDCKKWIQNARDKKKTWDEIDYACKNDENGLTSFLSNKKEDDFWVIEPEEWHLLVSKMQQVEEEGFGGFIGDPKKNLVGVPVHTGSCWIKYKRKLETPGSNFTYASIKNIELSSQKIITSARCWRCCSGPWWWTTYR